MELTFDNNLMEMKSSSKVTKIGVFGHYGNQNLGDEAIVAAVIQNIKHGMPNAEVYGFSINPEDTKKRHKIRAYPIRYIGRNHSSRWSGTTNPNGAQSYSSRERLGDVLLRVARRAFLLPTRFSGELRFLSTSYRLLTGFDLLLISGSNQFLDNFGGFMGYPYTLFKWSVLAKLARTKLAFVSVGAGPIDSVVSRTLVRIALLFSDYTSFRDNASKQQIEMPGFRPKAWVFPDLAHSLLRSRNGANHSSLRASNGRLVVGINPMPVYDRRYWCHPDEPKYAGYVRKLAALASTLLRKGYHVLFFNSMPKDEDVIKDVLASLDEDVRDKANPSQVIKSNRSVKDLMKTLASCDIIVATRFHGVVLSLLAERPVLGICYHRKSADLLKRVGLGKYFVKLDDFEVDDLFSRFQLLQANRYVETEKIRKKNQEYREALKAQYGTVLGLLT